MFFFLVFFSRCLLPLDVGCLVFGGGVVRASVLALGYCLSFAGFCFLSCHGFCFRRPGSGAQWLAAVANFGVYVDGKGDPGFPKGCASLASPLTVQRPVEDLLLTGLIVAAAVFCCGLFGIILCVPSPALGVV